MDKKPTMTLVAFLLAAIAMTAAIFALTCCKSQDVAEADVAQVTPIERASGCPLDAIEYDHLTNCAATRWSTDSAVLVGGC